MLKSSVITRIALDGIFIAAYLIAIGRTLAAYFRSRSQKRSLKTLERIYFALILISCFLITIALGSDIAFEMNRKDFHKANTFRLSSRFFSDATLVVLMCAVCQTALALGNLVIQMEQVDEEVNSTDTDFEEQIADKREELALESLRNQSKFRSVSSKLLLIVLPGIIGILFIIADIIAFSMHQKRVVSAMAPAEACKIQSEEKVIRGLSKLAVSITSIIACVCITKFVFDITTYYMYKFDPEELLRNPEKQAEEARLARMGLLFVILITIEAIFVGLRIIPQTINNWKNPAGACKADSTLFLIFRYLIAVKGIFQVHLMAWYFSSSTSVVPKPPAQVTNKMTVEEVLRKYGITPEDVTMDNTSTTPGQSTTDFSKQMTHSDHIIAGHDRSKSASSDTSEREDITAISILDEIQATPEPSVTIQAPAAEIVDVTSESVESEIDQNS